ncbi:MAG: hypothetical protein AUK03_13500 [Anaerolineae bacterium CG2_30_64_16]|nr:MAG: hypothetical protein AUK03_13500 [Anaerolineae bacterium CG2_30_64_16]
MDENLAIGVVDGCPLNCARKIVEGAGYRPAVSINLINDCGIKKRPPSAYAAEVVATAVAAIVRAVNSEAYA